MRERKGRRGRRGKSEPDAILANTNFRLVRTNNSRSVPRKQALRPHGLTPIHTISLINEDTRDLKTKNRNVTYIKNELASPPTPPRPAKMMAWRAKRKTRQLPELKNQGETTFPPSYPILSARARSTAIRCTKKLGSTRPSLLPNTPPSSIMGPTSDWRPPSTPSYAAPRSRTCPG